MTLKRLYSLVLALMLVAGVVNTPAWPYDFETHRAINDGAVSRSSLNDYLIQGLGLSQGTATTFNNRDVREWIREGGVLEDVPPQRTGNHFHYPLREWDRALLTDPPGSGFAVQSSVLWAQNPDQRPFLAPAETWSWIRARRELRDALTMPDVSDRNTAFAHTFRAIGQGLHLVADASVPAHTRNDSHIGLLGLTGEPFEIWVEGEARRRPGEIDDEQARARFLAEFVPISEHFSPSILGTAPNPLAPIPIAKVFDANVYDGTAGTLGLTGGVAVGISEFANANFFSYSTIFADRFDITHPRFSPFPASTAVEQFVDPTNNRRYWRKTSPGATVEHLATVSRLDFFRQVLVGGPPRTGGLDPVVHDEYARYLIRRAVGYSASLIDYFFRGTLDFTVSTGTTASNQILTITNTSAEAMQGTFSLYADNFSDVRSSVQGASFNLILGPGATGGPLSFTPPSQVQAYVLVFQGRLGNEEGVVAGKVNDWYAVTDVTPSTITVGQTTMLTITIKSNFSRKPRIITAALLNAHTGIHVSTSVTIPNTGHTTTQIALDIASAPFPIDILRTPRPLSLVVVAGADFHSITRADLNNQNPVNTIMSLVRVGQNSRLPIYQRVVTGKIMWVSGPNGSSSITFLNAFDTTPFTFTWKFKKANLIKIFVAPIDKETDFTDGKPGRSEFTGTQADFSTFTISFVEPGVNTVGSFMIIDADLTDGFLCISDVVSNGPAFDQSIHRFTRRECPE